MKQHATNAVILHRTNFAEADRIITALTSDRGKVKLVAKGVRKLKSRLSSGIELFSNNNLTYIEGKGSLHTLISSRPITSFRHITKDIDKTMVAYEILKITNKITEEDAEPAYYHLVISSLQGLDDLAIPVRICELWFFAQLLSITGHTPNLTHDVTGRSLAAQKRYSFGFEAMTFELQDNGVYETNDIKFLRLAFSLPSPQKLAQVQADNDRVASLATMVRNMVRLHLHLN